MVRKFLYFVAFIIVLMLLAAATYRLFGKELMEIAFVPKTEYVQQSKVETSAYADSNMWFSRPEIRSGNPALWTPDGHSPTQNAEAAVFFIHPTSYLGREYWNAPIDDKESQDRAKLFLRGQASTFNASGEIWAPKYRQAAFGSFLTDKPEAKQALEAAYADVLSAFDYFVSQQGENRPIILAGHSQGGLHLTNLLRDRVAGTALANRIVAAYVVGWPVSMETDIIALGLPACEAYGQSGCVLSWESFAEPADYAQVIDAFDSTTGFNERPRKGTKLMCTNPLNGALDGEAAADMNLGTLVPNEQLNQAGLVAKSVSARCDDRGFLLIGDPPEVGPYVLPGNNYHVYDFSLFWANIRQDVAARLATHSAK